MRVTFVFGLLSLEICSTAHRTPSPHCAPNGRQTFVGIVDPQMQPELGARREHPVRLIGALGDQVVDQNSGVALGPADYQPAPDAPTSQAAFMPAISPWQAASS